jgi:hypothetical protein
MKNILLLGMSYLWFPKEDIEGRTLNGIMSKVKSKTITAIDGRDHARILALENFGNYTVYTVSNQNAGNYNNERHLNYNFNHRKFLTQLRQLLSSNSVNNIKLSQVSCLLYFVLSFDFCVFIITRINFIL